ncbi:uncharacterized protein [Fopius arisanus]|uniref:Integrase catalytic domain-containing protein n=1 Tax=Fopius arisanus TaxID=64838 RepID=A0A9R1U900_9HYME|nr:PREDICTED: uncharacterized protein LOC105272914 [Fopius arisanus]
MGAAVYLRTSTPEAEPTVTLVCAKTKVAPLKKFTIPRLELTAALILTELAAHVLKVLELENVEIHLRSDSSVAITWVNGHSSRWKDFVQNRVIKIQETLPTAKWRHINGIDNPADCASRGITPAALAEHQLWWNGPEWLTLPQDQCPASTFNAAQEAALEERPSTARNHPVRMNNPDDLLNRYAPWRRLLRISAIVHRVVKRFQHQDEPTGRIITPQEIEEGRIYWVKHTQEQYFAQEINTLSNGGSLPANHRLSTLTPFVDGEGVLRLGGRLGHTRLDREEKHPAIIPRHSRISTLIIEHAHARSLHGGTQLTLAHIRQKYWIIGGRAPVRSHILKCIICARHRATRAQQIMGQLPERRVTPTRPFLHSGVDFAGPFNILRWRGSGASTKMYKGRGICATITSDRGTNFIGAQRQLGQRFDEAQREFRDLAFHLASEGNQWKFIPPHSPHVGGKCEAAVKSVKYHLLRIMGSSTLTYEEFTTLLTQIEAVLNSRPLCPLTNDPEDASALTPGHFLIGETLNAIPEPSLLQLNEARLNRWQLITQKLQHFWDRWSKECLHRYQSIYKWKHPVNDIQPGTLLLITDDRFPPTKWPLARVINIHPGKDERTRVVDLRTSTQITSRTIHQLVPLPINADHLENPTDSRTTN